MNDGQTGEILVKNIKTLEESIEAIIQNKTNINVIIKKLEGVEKKLENQKEEFSKKISEIEKNFKNEIEKLRDEFKNNGLNESPNTEKNNFNFPSKLEDKKEGEEGSNLNSENENQETKLIEENKRLEEENKKLKKEKEEEVGKKDKRISELTEKNKKLKEDLTQEKNNFSNFKKGAEDGVLRLNGEIESKDAKINDLLREKTNLEKDVDDLRREIRSKNQDITNLKNQVSSLTEDVKNREDKISGLKKDKNNLISRLADFKDLEELEALYSEYLKIPENDREKYDAILKPHLGKDMFLYLVTTKFSNYKDFLKNDFIENANFYAVLVKIYDYVINVMNKEYDEEVYEFLNPEIGERYNPISQIPSSNSVSNGDVARVIVKGYQRKRDKKLLYQSIVLLK